MINARMKFGRERREFLRQWKAERGCAHCDEHDPVCLTFHHLDPATKMIKVSAMTGMSWDRIDEEIAKCEVVCANCHLKIEHRKRMEVQ